MPLKLSRRNFMTGVAAAATAAPLEDRRRIGAEYFELTDVTLKLKGLDPAHDGLKVAQLSDIHIGDATPDGRIFAALRAVNEAKPDVVILTGDYVTQSRRPLERISYVLKGIEAPTYAVLGNHDHWVDAKAVRTALEKNGYAVLQNQSTVMQVKGAPLNIIGIDDAVTRHDDTEKSLKGVAPGSRLVLAHAPPTARKLPKDANLACFSGHTHGGQFVIPGLTSALFRVANQPFVRGHYEVEGNQLYVNRGLGFGRGGPAVRMGSDPEVSVFTLKVAT